jgi:Flp pilus assembly pilin Flp
MDLLRKLYVKADELVPGQTMAEYALILAAVAVVVYAGYQTMGTTVTTLLSSVNNKL